MSNPTLQRAHIDSRVCALCQRKQPSTSLHCLAEHGRQQRAGAERAAVRRAAGQAQRPAASLSCARLWLGNMGCLVGEQIDEQVNVKVLAKECGLPGNRGCGATADRRAVWRRLGAAGVAAQLSQVRGEPAGAGGDGRGRTEEAGYGLKKLDVDGLKKLDVDDWFAGMSMVRGLDRLQALAQLRAVAVRRGGQWNTVWLGNVDVDWSELVTRV